MTSILLCVILSNPQIIFDTSHPMIKDDLSINNPLIIEIKGRIDDHVADKFDKQMTEAYQTGQPFIIVTIDTYGGSVYSLLRMVDVMKSSKVPIITVVVGKAMSAGVVLLTCGTEGFRYASQHSTMMIHEVSSSMRGKIKDNEISMEEAMRLNSLLFKIMDKNIKKRPGYLWEKVKKNGHADWFLTSKQALKHNIINRIGVPDIGLKVNVRIKLISN